MTDYTEGWTKDGLIAFAIFDDWREMALPEWQMNDEKRYWIEISAATVPTPPARASRVAIEMDDGQGHERLLPQERQLDVSGPLVHSNG